MYFGHIKSITHLICAYKIVHKVKFIANFNIYILYFRPAVLTFMFCVCLEILHVLLEILISSANHRPKSTILFPRETKKIKKPNQGGETTNAHLLFIAARKTIYNDL